MVDWRKTGGEGPLSAHTEIVEDNLFQSVVFRYALD